MTKHNEQLRKERLLAGLEPKLRDLGREVLNASTSEERLREITQKGLDHHGSNDCQYKDVSTNVWGDYTDEQLAEKLVSDDIPGHVKDDIAEFVISRKALPAEEE